MSQQQDDPSNAVISTKIRMNVVMDKIPKDRGNITRVTIEISEQRLFE
eukprot:CAMPEP_0201570176 /NCGR_PEP_ID=MMETSP0190_2-20130828/12309_1 /ASSEMBLY_ACC=CAM_ASM_000263 /TAXON_ID=37353 /ORGANISM="Rosalina sp." /LENGTH=47 /DNA_ID= /DNA_START= /DNA_END= /DNA_ORIENTATION=